MRPELVRVGNPSHGPRRIELGRRELEIRPDLGHVLVSEHEVTGGTSHLLENALAANPLIRDLLIVRSLQRTNIDVALDTSRLHRVALEQRTVPVLDIAMRHLHRIDGWALSLMAGSASELL